MTLLITEGYGVRATTIEGQNAYTQMLCVISYELLEVANARHQTALCAFHSFLVEVQTKLATYVRCMRNSNLAPVVQRWIALSTG